MFANTGASSTETQHRLPSDKKLLQNISGRYTVDTRHWPCFWKICKREGLVWLLDSSFENYIAYLFNWGHHTLTCSIKLDQHNPNTAQPINTNGLLNSPKTSLTNTTKTNKNRIIVNSPVKAFTYTNWLFCKYHNILYYRLSF